MHFFVQGHFDVPVDRERLTQESSWNRWILSKVPQQLARLSERVLRCTGDPPLALAQALGLLELLPQPADLSSPLFRRLVLGLPAAFRQVRVAPCADGTLRSPQSTLVASRDVAALFEGESAVLEDEPKHFVHTDASSRALAQLEALGAQRFELEQLVALPRMLLACFATLGTEELGVGARQPLMLCSEHGQGALRLLPAITPNLFRSDTPTLESLFRRAGSFYLAAQGTAEQRDQLGRFYGRMRIKPLRAAYRLVVDESGLDRSEHCARQIQQLLGTLGALASVLPRVRMQRTLLDPRGWVDQRRLVPLVTAGRVRAIEGLRVAYRLEGVGDVRSEISAVFDPTAEELLIDSSLLDESGLLATGLAGGLLDCVYEGPGEEGLSDILEILLPLQTRTAMDAYLDRRHFPAAEGPERGSVVEQLRTRLAELMDYGLDRRLAQRFDQLEGRDLTRWRDDALLDTILDDSEEANLSQAAQRVAPALLQALDLADPSDALRRALTALLAAPSLSEVPAGLLGSAGAHAPALAAPTRTDGPSTAVDSYALLDLIRDACEQRRETTDGALTHSCGTSR